MPMKISVVVKYEVFIGTCKYWIANELCSVQHYNLKFLICIAGPVASGGTNVCTDGIADQSKLRSQYQV